MFFFETYKRLSVDPKKNIIQITHVDTLQTQMIKKKKKEFPFVSISVKKMKATNLDLCTSEVTHLQMPAFRTQQSDNLPCFVKLMNHLKIKGFIAKLYYQTS